VQTRGKLERVDRRERSCDVLHVGRAVQTRRAGREGIGERLVTGEIRYEARRYPGDASRRDPKTARGLGSLARLDDAKDGPEDFAGEGGANHGFGLSCEGKRELGERASVAASRADCRRFQIKLMTARAACIFVRLSVVLDVVRPVVSAVETRSGEGCEHQVRRRRGRGAAHDATCAQLNATMIQDSQRS
jgi:hypothetical protein